ncbi:hypothetical protein HDV57DRAFT_389489 [Trichoderma longibrachiatum]
MYLVSYAPCPHVLTSARSQIWDQASHVPQLPHMLQQAFSGHGLRVASSTPAGGFLVPGLVGPHTALGTGAGRGGLPLLRQMSWPTRMDLHPFQPLSRRRCQPVCLRLEVVKGGWGKGGWSESPSLPVKLHHIGCLEAV